MSGRCVLPDKVCNLALPVLANYTIFRLCCQLMYLNTILHKFGKGKTQTTVHKWKLNMLKITDCFSTKEDLHAFCQRLKEACDNQGIRLGKNNTKAQAIVASIFGEKDYNRALGALAQNQSTPEKTTSRFLTEDDIQSLRMITNKKPVFHVSMLSDQSSRTLLWGYTVERHSFHVYLADGLAHLLIYDHDQTIIRHLSGDSIPFDELVPSKRAYPEACDYEFCSLVQRYHEYGVPFTTYDYRAKEHRGAGPYFGKKAEELNPLKTLYIKSRELSLEIQKAVRSAFLEQKKWLNGYDFLQKEDKYDSESWSISGRLTDSIREIGFAGCNNREITEEMKNHFLKSLQDEEFLSYLSHDAESNMKLISDFCRTFGELFEERGFKNTIVQINFPDEE